MKNTINLISYKVEILKAKVKSIFLSENKKDKEATRLKIADLPLPKGSLNWDKNRVELRNSILNRNLKNFINWKIVQNTMFHRANLKELEYLKSRKDWDILKEAVKETNIGNPPNNRNIIHQAYSLAQYFNNINDIKKVDSIVEIGGGYGCMCRLIHKLGFRGKYTIFDLPEFLILQEYYLNRHKLSVNFTDKLEGLKGELLIGLWLISEMPIILRNKIFSKFRYYLIAYQNEFEGVDNIEYFGKFKGKNYIIPHLRNNRYLIN